MDAQSHIKVINHGFTIIRIDDYPAIRIKYKDEEHREWTTLENYPSKSARDKAFKELMQQPFIIQD
jgi:hypothetical protein